MQNGFLGMLDVAGRIAINKAMLAADDLVLQVVYEDRDGVVTERMISPIRYLDETSILALCLCRETPRRFDLNRCSRVQLVDANEVLMPVAIKVLHDPSDNANGSAARKPIASAADAANRRQQLRRPVD